MKNLAESASLAGSIVELKTAAAALSRKTDSLGDRELGEQVAVLNLVLERYSVVPEPSPTQPAS